MSGQGRLGHQGRQGHPSPVAGRAPGTATVVLRAVSTAPWLSAMLVLVAAVLSFLGAAAPTLLHEGRTATVRHEIDRLPEQLRSPLASVDALPRFDEPSDAGSGVWASALAEAEDARRALPEPLRGRLAEPRMIATTAYVPSISETAAPKNRVALIADPGFEARSTVTQGRPPRPTPLQDGVEVLLAEPVAEALRWRVGEARRLGDVEVRVTGLFTANGAVNGAANGAMNGEGAADWAFIGGSLAPQTEVTKDGELILLGAAFTARDEAPAFAGFADQVGTEAWMPFDHAGLDADEAATVAQQLRLFAATPVSLSTDTDHLYHQQELVYGTAVPDAIDEGVSRGLAMTAVVTVVAVGPIAVAAVALALAARMLALRRVGTARLMQARGASTRRLTALLGGEGLVLGALGAALGTGAAAIVPGGDGLLSLLVPALLALVPATVLPVSALSDARSRERRDLGGMSAGARWRRVAVEGAVLVVTAALVAALLARGGGAGGPDPLLMALPILLAASCGVLALRVLPPILRLVEQRGARSPGLLPLLGPARARRDPVVRTAPVLAVVAGIGVAVFSVAFAATVATGIVRSANASTGADLRVDVGYVATEQEERIAEIPGVRAVAALAADTTAEVKVGGARSERIRVYVIDASAFAQVQEGMDGALPLSEALDDDGDDVPVLVSDTLHDALGGAAAFEVDGEPVRTVGVAPAQNPFGSAERWVILDRANAERLGVRLTATSQLYLALTPGTDSASVAAAVHDLLGAEVATSVPRDASAALADDPAYALVQAALIAASTIVALLLAFAVGATLVLGAPARGRLLALLRTAGYPRRGELPMVAWEVGPALLIALPFGALAGAAMSLLVIGGIDLRGFTGGTSQPTVAWGGWWQPAVVVGFVLVVLVAIVVATVFAARFGASGAVRDVDEEG
ncbi:putative ABC transport system permease protein [Microbacterium resistens]|uniref:ABC transport system permease protein n=1 Tax=Microbacterium resistens TaxID=156977 RepID=A0ABU1S8J1_9MICO|nr:ABC transporter permease [Microbacterium resistens]MDR6865929.1 putative ABC transport system permease protein [Microbacterium resistens]